MSNFMVTVSDYNSSAYGSGFGWWKTNIEAKLRNKCELLFDEGIRYVNLSGKDLVNDTVFDEGFSNISIIGHSHFKKLHVEKQVMTGNKLFGINIDKSGMLCPHGSGEIIVSPEGYPVAEYFREKKVLFILFNINSTNRSEDLILFTSIIDEWLKVHFKSNSIEEMIKKAQDEKKKAEMKVFIDGVTRATKTELDGIMSKVRNYNSNIEDYKRKIVLAIRNRELTMNSKPILEARLASIEKNLDKEFDLIRDNKKVLDFKIENGKMVIFTDTLYAYTQHDERYYIGKYRIEVDINTAKIRYFNDETRHGYWTNNDPHPHVDGGSGSPCLGNIAETISVLCSQYQLYPLVTIVINFLEAVNTDDSAGKNVVKWDKVDESGAIILKGGEEEADDGSEIDEIYECHNCGHEMCADDNEHVICVSCDNIFCLECAPYRSCDNCPIDEDERNCDDCNIPEDYICENCMNEYNENHNRLQTEEE